MEEIDLFNPTIDNSPLVVTGDIPTPKCGGSVTHTTLFNMGRYFISRYRSAPLTYWDDQISNLKSNQISKAPQIHLTILLQDACANHSHSFESTKAIVEPSGSL